MAQGPTPKPSPAPAAVGPAGPSQLDTLLPNPPPYEAATRVEAGNDVDRRSYRSRVNSRFFSAWFWGVVVWVLMSGLIRSYYEILWPRHRHRVHQHSETDGSSSYSLPDNVTVGICQEWHMKENKHSAMPFIGELQFDLPINSESLFLFSRGPLAQGKLHITTDTKIPADKVRVDVTMHAVAQWLRYSSKVCSASRKTGHHGVGIFASPMGPNISHESTQLMAFDTKLSFPPGSSNFIKGLDVDMPNFAQRIGNMSNYLFDRLVIQTSKFPVEVDALRVNNGSIETSWAPITGVFNTSSTLILKTTMSPISVDIGAHSDGNVTQVIVSTTAFPLRANISLLADSPSNKGDFEVSTSTTYGSLDVRFPTQALDSTLRFSGSGSNAPASVTLDSTYEGNILVRTSNYHPSYVLREPSLDPGGRRRQRHIDLRLDDATLSGEVSWIDGRHEPKGQVVLYTTNNEATVEL
ncbi:hypothetical protein CVT24_007362 [Panaeolus cyanescens]|uniref:Uncharacterized protein n=1 Tax=Panaeolus cyanescens TaxID=181874 RepID=A0A409YL15_9AGAR|nr:hypothetical protein CVT24_007362 [Panaeolus cyanescens]